MATSEESNAPLVSVVIQNYNGKAHLEKWLNSVLNVDYPNFEVIIVDDASSDDSLKFLSKRSKFDSRMKIIRNQERVGASEGRNIAIREAKGKYVLFLDNDVKVERNLINELVTVFQSDSNIGAVQAKVLFMDHPNVINSAGGFIDETGEVILRGFKETDVKQYEMTDEIFFASGCALFSSRKVLLEAGLFDRRLNFWYEDVDICWRIRLIGYKILLAPKSVVYHFEGGSGPTRSFRINNYWALKNRLLMLINNYGTATLIKSALKILIRTRRVFRSRTLARGFLYIIVNFKEVWRIRQQIQISLRRVSDRNLQPLIKRARLVVYW